MTEANTPKASAFRNPIACAGLTTRMCDDWQVN